MSSTSPWDNLNRYYDANIMIRKENIRSTLLLYLDFSRVDLVCLLRSLTKHLIGHVVLHSKKKMGLGGTIIFVCFGKWKRDRGNKQKKKCLYKQHGRACMIVVCVTR